MYFLCAQAINFFFFLVLVIVVLDVALHEDRSVSYKLRAK